LVIGTIGSSTPVTCSLKNNKNRIFISSIFIVVEELSKCKVTRKLGNLFREDKLSKWPL